jgi:hypothetical protein
LVLWWSARRFEKRLAKIETDKTQSHIDAWWAKKDDEPNELGQVYPYSVHKEWDGRSGEVKIAKLAHDWGFRALGRDRPYTIPVGEHAVFVRPEAWFAVLPDATTSRHVLSTKQKTNLHLRGADRPAERGSASAGGASLASNFDGMAARSRFASVALSPPASSGSAASSTAIALAPAAVSLILYE